MVTLVFGKTTAIYTSIMMSSTYVACRTKWLIGSLKCWTL